MGWMSQLCGENENDYIEVHKNHYNDLIEKSKELEIYKKALELMADDLSVHAPTMCNSMCKGNRTVEESYMQAARKEVDRIEKAEGEK